MRMSESPFGRDFLVARFDEEAAIVAAARAVRGAGFRIFDAFTPYPVHGLDHAMGIRDSRLPIVAFAGGAVGLLTTLAFEWYAASYDWPLDVGGKPDNAILPFVPIAFELTILAAALSIVAAFLLRCRLAPGRRARAHALGATANVFALVLRWRDTAFDARHAERLLLDAGARDVRRMAVDL
jgi:hypothetical protein